MVLSVRLRVGKISSGLRPEEVPDLRLRKDRFFQSAPYDAWNAPTSGIQYMVANTAALQQSQQQGLRNLWRQGNLCLRRVECQLRGVLAGYGANLGTRLDYRPHRCEWELRARQLRLGANVGTGKKSTSSFTMEGRSKAYKREIYK